MNLPQKPVLKISSFEPVLIKNWILNLSIDRTTDGVCIIMIHRFDHTLRCGYVKGREEAAKFIEHIVDVYK